MIYLFSVWLSFVVAKTVSYDLVVKAEPVNLSGHKTVPWALTVNGGIPAPTLEFAEGDVAEIRVRNEIPNQELSIHWHGILLPNEMDGVPYVTTPPIKSGSTYVFRFPIRQHGTYWYHSHTGLQEQKGVLGAFIIHPAKKQIQADRDLVVILSDWTDENPDQVLRNLRKDGDYYLIKKHNVRSWWGALKAGELGHYVSNQWMRMPGMDLSDVGYDAFLINGKRNSVLLADAKPGERVRLRMINAGASTYFRVAVGQQPLKVISADGIDIQPTFAREILIGMAETYDVLLTIPKGKHLELRATAQDVTGYASAVIGSSGEIERAADLPAPDPYEPMNHMGHMSMDSMNHDVKHNEKPTNGGQDHSAHHGHQMMGKMTPKQDKIIDQLTVDQISSIGKTLFPADKNTHEVRLVLGGSMERYVWHLNGKAIYQDRTIDVNEGDVIRIIFENDTMMHHPMHLHGHFFRVLNSFGMTSPLKHTVDVPPHGARTIEFLANEPGQWLLHCHNLYHMKTGMARVVKYHSFIPKPEIAKLQKDDPHMHNHLYSSGRLEAATNHMQVDGKLMRTWDELAFKFENREYNNLGEAEGHLVYQRWQSKYFNLLGGFEFFHGYEEHQWRGVAGVGYILPFNVEAQALVDHRGQFHLELERRFQWTRWWLSDVDWSIRQSAKSEFEVTLMYHPTWNWYAGFMFTEEDAGIGLQYTF
ncbi:MAG: multicopper oxidase domain-containing protein [Bdellovibrionales bacterium]